MLIKEDILAWLILLSLPYRTLLALGCHVGMGDEKAEENLKKIKLPKTYVKVTDCVCFVTVVCLNRNVCPLDM